MSKAIKEIFSFASFVEGLKKIERFKGQYYWAKYPKLPRYESVADHTWRICLLLLILEKHLSKKINLEKALRMAVIHDLPEVIAGDGNPLGTDGKGKGSYAFHKKLKEKRFALEKKAAEKLFAKLSGGEGKKLLNLWLEYESDKSFEAKVVRGLDKLEAFLQVLEYRKGHMYKDHLEIGSAYALKYSKVDPAIEEFGKLIDASMRKKFKAFKK